MNKGLKINYLNSFLHLYFYILEDKINSTQNELNSIKFQSEEANTDEFVKRYFKEYILKNPTIKGTNLKSLCINIDSNPITIKIDRFNTFQVINVFLPAELDETKKKKISETKNAVYTSPDLYLEISDGETSYFESLELKSTKNNNIPGSSVQQVAPFEWVIFVKRSEKKTIVSTGHYINSITEKLPFPDRSPRPQIGFNTLQQWNKKNRAVKNNILFINYDSSQNQSKIKLLADWQDYLASEWLNIVQSNKAQKNEKWFNNALRKFALKFLEYTETLSTEEKQKLTDTLNSLIK
ncbi:hypothetical protein [Aureispira anguillae]|uniref:Uncharacterized protein n=1 Tax=Aureispira anguillae TaxID=2864201 RepID=A0A915YLP8_9BACT|nr:hypothetical protein [Aureispira anguillae]BDS15241.1 hypothetical protein AsAng_0060250 [Aureispira anguillae]